MSINLLIVYFYIMMHTGAFGTGAVAEIEGVEIGAGRLLVADKGTEVETQTVIGGGDALEGKLLQIFMKSCALFRNSTWLHKQLFIRKQ